MEKIVVIGRIMFLNSQFRKYIIKPVLSSAPFIWTPDSEEILVATMAEFSQERD